MDGLLGAIVILQVIVVISLLNSLLSGSSRKYLKKGSDYNYIPNISEVVGSGKKYDVSGTWTAGESGTTLLITKVDDDKFDVALTRQGSTRVNERLKANMDHFNGVLTVNNPVDIGDPYYGDDYSTPALILLLDPNLEDKLIDPYAASIYNKVPASPAGGNVITHLSGIWKDNDSPDLLDIKVTDYLIEGSLAENKIIGIFNPESMKFVLFLKGYPVPGYYDNNVFVVLFMNQVYEFRKVMDYKP
jgi:hypothetical protein